MLESLSKLQESKDHQIKSNTEHSLNSSLFEQNKKAVSDKLTLQKISLIAKASQENEDKVDAFVIKGISIVNVNIGGDKESLRIENPKQY